MNSAISDLNLYQLSHINRDDGIRDQFNNQVFLCIVNTKRPVRSSTCLGLASLSPFSAGPRASTTLTTYDGKQLELLCTGLAEMANEVRSFDMCLYKSPPSPPQSKISSEGGGMFSSDFASSPSSYLNQCSRNPGQME